MFSQTCLSLVCLVLLWVWSGGEALAQTQQASVDDDAFRRELDAYVGRVLKALEVPGLSVAVVHDGKTILIRGYGVRRLGEKDPVTGHTRFQIGSMSKTFTTTAVGILVDEGKLNWDDPVEKYLPDFRLYAPYVTREITVRDLLSHRSGLGEFAGDLLWWPKTNYTEDDIYRRLRYVKPAFGFRNQYSYNNLVFRVAGRLFPAIARQTWAEFVRKRIFLPLKMTDSLIAAREVDLTRDDVAAPHQDLDGKVTPIPPFSTDFPDPAASICSSAADMATWMLVHLDDGNIPADGKNVVPGRLFGEAVAEALQSPQSLLPGRQIAAEALGWLLFPEGTERTVSCGGAMPGMNSQIFLIPSRRLGIAVLTNYESATAPGGGISAYALIIRWILARYLNREPPSSPEQIAQTAARNRSASKNLLSDLFARKPKDARPSLPLSGYAGSYQDDWYGGATLSVVDGKSLVLTFDHTPDLIGDLEHLREDTFAVRWRKRNLNADAFVTFALTPEGKVEQFKMKAISADTDPSFDFQDLLFRPVVR